MDKLGQIIADVSQSNFAAKDLIYTHITTNVIPNLPATSVDNESPPLQLLCYTARNILHPTLGLALTSDLANLLAQIEAIRKLAVDVAAKALEKEGSMAMSRVWLGAGKTLTGFVREKGQRKQRNLYRSIVLSLCRLHIHSLWTSEESHSLPKRMLTYFPTAFSQTLDNPGQSLFLYDLSDQEKEEMRLAGLATKQFVADAGVWEEKRRQYWVTNRLPLDTLYADTEFFSYKRDFCARFRPPAEEKELVEAIERYLRSVESMVEVLESMFETGERST